MGLDALDGDKLKLLDALIESQRKTRRSKRDDPTPRLLFEIYNMSQNNMSKVLTSSAMWLPPESSRVLVDQGLIQRVPGENEEKYALTLKGIAEAMKLRYGQTLEEQFLRFLELSDQKFATVDQIPFKWDEKLVSLSLILMASTSSSSAIRLNNETNQTVLGNVFNGVLSSLRGYGVVERGEKLREVSRGESPVMAVMSRLNTLARKSNHYYENVPQESAYYFDIEVEGKIDEKKLHFLLSKIFFRSPETNFDGLQKDLSDIGQLYSPRFLGRSINPLNAITILRKMRDFFDTDVHRITVPKLPSSSVATVEN